MKPSRLSRVLTNILAFFPRTQHHMLTSAVAQSSEGILSRAYAEYTRRMDAEKASYEEELTPTPVFGVVTIDEAIADLDNRGNAC